MNLDMKLKFNFNKRNKYKNICSIEGCNNSACGKYCNVIDYTIIDAEDINKISKYKISKCGNYAYVMVFYVILLFLK